METDSFEYCGFTKPEFLSDAKKSRQRDGRDLTSAIGFSESLWEALNPGTEMPSGWVRPHAYASAVQYVPNYPVVAFSGRIAVIPAGQPIICMLDRL